MAKAKRERREQVGREGVDLQSGRYLQVKDSHCQHTEAQRTPHRPDNPVATAAEKKKLYFNVVQGPMENQTVTVEGGGVNATIITANIAATNGIIHIIDRLLGVPYTTVLDKLRTDPMLKNYVNRCAEASGISTPFRIPSFRNRIKYRIPIFCSHDEMIYRTMICPLREKYLYLGNCENGILRTSLDTRGSVMLPRVDMIFARHTKQILERHLIIADQAYTMAKLKEMSNDTLYLPAARDILKLRIKEHSENASPRLSPTLSNLVLSRRDFLAMISIEKELANSLDYRNASVFSSAMTHVTRPWLPLRNKNN
ncbi:Fasciclin-1 [Atta colombica]|uniref:Fasciclin-1 n=1 Tax=Atta colombica TaxID=520822 RepID=A0A195BTF5_9HYME|nr:Fasciclin-1 [Atta colombica]